MTETPRDDKPKPARRPRIKLPFDNRREDMGSWTYDHRIGLCVTLIAYLALMIVFVSSKIVVGRRTHQQGMYIDLQTLAEMEQERDRLEREVRERQRQEEIDWRSIRNQASNENALNEKLRDDRGTNAAALNDAAAEAERNKVHNVRESTAPQDALVIDDDISKIQYKLAKCCNPIKGDDVFGFVTISAGITIHRCDCPNAAIERRKPEERGRWIKVSWGTDVKESYQTALDIYAKDRLDLVLDVSAALSSSQTRVASINATTTADGFAVIHLSIFISDAQHLAAVMRRLHQISGVMKGDRPAG